MDQALNSQKTPHTSPLRASYGMSFVSILLKNDRVIKGFYCRKFILSHTWQWKVSDLTRGIRCFRYLRSNTSEELALSNVMEKILLGNQSISKYAIYHVISLDRNRQMVLLWVTFIKNIHSYLSSWCSIWTPRKCIRSITKSWRHATLPIHGPGVMLGSHILGVTFFNCVR